MKNSPTLPLPRAPGRHLTPAEWEAAMDDPKAIILDCRNHYESEVWTKGQKNVCSSECMEKNPGFGRSLLLLTAETTTSQR